jgi:hypothetical protein
MNRRSFLTHCALGSAGLAAFIQGCQPRVDNGTGLDLEPDASKTLPGERPAIDLDAPSVFETATFALG